MLTCQTKYHGRIEYSEDAVMRFPDGLPGFEEQTKYLPIELPSMRPIVFLQSLSNPDLCFITLPVFVVDGDYTLLLSPRDLTAIGLPQDKDPQIGIDVLCLVLLTIQENGPTTANLMAPIVMNLTTRQAVQAISDDGYSHQHMFLEPQPEAVC